ncbi:hypothetical protein SDC9_44731 [bioreactor metagenome]|uniref:Uncharacterized protein n=1 Tax=bioreactor metagenome TaxID=1076179 RepID=A0A644W466_9ZZZZ
MSVSRPGRFSRRRSLCPKKTADLGSIGTVGIYEPGVFPEEDERDFPGGAVPVLGQVDEGPVVVFLPRGTCLVIAGPVEQHDRVGVLLDSAAVPQVGKLRLLLRPLLHRPGELGQGDDGNFEFPGHSLQSPGNFRHFLLLVLDPPRGVHELEVVHHHQSQVLVPGLEAAAPCPEFQGGQHGAVVNVDRGLGEPAGSFSESFPGGFRKGAVPEVVDVYPGLGAQHPLDKLLRAHFQAEDEHRAPHSLPAELGDVDGKGRFSHGGTGGHDVQASRLESAHEPVEFVESRIETRHVLVRTVVLLLDLEEGFAEDFADVPEVGGVPLLGDLEHRPFRFLENLVHVELLGITELDDGVPRGDEPPVDCLVPDDARMVFHVGRCGDAVHEGSDKGLPPQAFTFSLPGEFLQEGEGIHRLVPLGHFVDDFVGGPVVQVIKILRLENLKDDIERLPVHETCAESCTLRLRGDGGRSVP